MSTPASPARSPMRTWALYLFRLFLRGILSLRYRIAVEGLTEIVRRPDPRPLLILPSHSALIDPIILYSLLLPLAPRPLADQRQVKNFWIRAVLSFVRPIVIPDMQRDGRGARSAIREGLARAIHALQTGDTIMLYPSGRITRDGKDHVGSNSAAYRIYAALSPVNLAPPCDATANDAARDAARDTPGQAPDTAAGQAAACPGCRVVVARVRGLWGSRFSIGYASKAGHTTQSPLFLPLFFSGIRDICCNGLFFMPRRPVRVVFAEIPLPPTEAGHMAFNRALEAFYQAEPQSPLLVPRYFWRKA